LDLGEYASGNRIFLSDEMNLELVRIKERADILAMISMSLFERVGEPIDALIEHINLWSELADITSTIPIKVQEMHPNVSFAELSKRLDESVSKEGKVSRFTSQIENEFSLLARQLEVLYKSVAETK
jgi:hypothetical protein